MVTKFIKFTKFIKITKFIKFTMVTKFIEFTKFTNFGHLEQIISKELLDFQHENELHSTIDES